MCVNCSLRDIYREPPPLRTMLTNLRISEASKPTIWILQFNKYRSLSSDRESSATQLSMSIELLGCIQGGVQSSLTGTDTSEIVEAIFCERVVSTSASGTPSHEISWWVVECGPHCEFLTSLFWFCCAFKEFLWLFAEVAGPFWTGYDSSFRHAIYVSQKIMMVRNQEETS